MSHFTVMVIGENPEQQLAPYQENNMGDCPKEYMKFIVYDEDGKDHVFDSEEDFKKSGIKVAEDEEGRWENPNSKWDWYVLGGRWTGFFKVKANAVLAEVGRPGILTAPAEVGYADQVLKGDIDIDGMRNEAGLKAQNTYEKMMRIFGDLPPNITWEDVRESFKDDINGAREFYNSQPRVVAIRDSREWGYNADDFLISKEEYIEDARNAALSPYAVVKDGKWYQKGRMGWFWMSTNEMTQQEWNKQVSDMIDSIPDDTMISLVDCHI